MTRLLLTLLALLTGLAAQLSPAQAAVRNAGAAQVGAIERVPCQPEIAARAAIRPLEVPVGRLPAVNVRSLPFGTYATVPVPTVLTRIDRARE